MPRNPSIVPSWMLQKIGRVGDHLRVFRSLQWLGLKTTLYCFCISDTPPRSSRPGPGALQWVDATRPEKGRRRTTAAVTEASEERSLSFSLPLTGRSLGECALLSSSPVLQKEMLRAVSRLCVAVRGNQRCHGYRSRHLGHN